MREVTEFNYKYLLDKSDEEIIETVGMAEMPLIAWILDKKYNGVSNLIDIGGDCMIRFGETNVANMSYLATYLHFFYADSEKVRMIGNISFPAVFDNRFRFFILINGEKIYCPLKDYNFDRYIENSRYEIRNSFDYSFAYKDYISGSEEGALSIEFGFETDGISSICNKINSMRFSPLADVIQGQFYAKDGKIFRIEQNRILCKKASFDEVKEYEREFREKFRTVLSSQNEKKSERIGDNKEKKDNIFDYEQICSLRDYYYKFTESEHKPVWMFMDRPDRADDNAIVLFEYVQKYTNIDSYFIISDKSPDFAKISEIGKTIPLYSERHFELSLTADCIISSQCNGAVENPFWNYAEYFRDLYHRPKMIFLQHGVIKDDMSLTLNRFNTGFTGFVTSTEEEYHSILDYPYNYTEDEVWLTGLPRYDKLYNDDAKIILVMPSWRKGLMEQTWDESGNTMKWTLKEGFRESDYYINYINLLNNSKLLKFSKQKGYKICFMVHPLMADCFKEEKIQDNVEIWTDNVSYRDAFAKGSVLITDYSSVAFDFSYLRKPVIYYQFDKDRFFKEHTYRKGYFDYKTDGMGEVVFNERKLVRIIIGYIKKDCAVKPGYSERIEKMWKYDNEFCDRVYHKILICQKKY